MIDMKEHPEIEEAVALGLLLGQLQALDLNGYEVLYGMYLADELTTSEAIYEAKQAIAYIRAINTEGGAK